MAQFTYEYVKPIKEHFLNNSITPNHFSRWSQENLYRTSYGELWSNVTFTFSICIIFFQKPQEPKTVQIPGYGGFIPGVVAENDFGKSFAQLTRKTLSRDSLGANPLKLSSTGLNFTRHDFLDPSLTACSNKYGKQSILDNHPCQNTREKITEFQASFKNPSKLVPPTFRETDKFLQSNKELTKLSGFLANYQQLDGQGWIPHKVLNARRDLTEYRSRFNQEKPIHRNAILFRLRKLKNKNAAY